MTADAKVLEQNAVPTTPVINPVQSPVGSPNKEAPYISGVAELKPAGLEVVHNLDVQLREAGVAENTGRPNLNAEQVGERIKHSDPVLPASTSPAKNVILPMSHKEAEIEGRTGQVNNSRTWLGKLISKIIGEEEALRVS